MHLRPFQAETKRLRNEAHERVKGSGVAQRSHVLISSPTGSGKTAMMSDNIVSQDAPQVAMAHRGELVGQISKALANFGVRHDIIGAKTTVTRIRNEHLDEFGINYIDPKSHIKVASVDTLIGINPADRWVKSVRHVHNDEAHHVLRANKWGKALDLFTDADSTGYTGTALRADGKGLGAHADGYYHELVELVRTRHLIDQGYLVDYRYVWEDTADLDLSHVNTGATGDYVYQQLRKAVHASNRLLSGVVDAYLEFANNTQCIVFATDIEHATDIAAEFRAKGIAAEVVHGKTDPGVRTDVLKRFRRRNVQVLINVDLFGEGFDVPGVESVILARPTKSFPLYAQQVGRVLRLMLERALADQWGVFSDAQRLAYIATSGKPFGIVIDLVDNIIDNGLPDSLTRQFTLDRRVSVPRELDPNIIGLKRCVNRNPLCLKPYERFRTSCPHCGHTPEPAERATLKQVDGDIGFLDPALLAALRGQIDALQQPPRYPGDNYQVNAGIWNRRQEQIHELDALKHAMMVWGAGMSVRTPGGMSDREQAKAFYLTFGVDVLTAQSLTRADAAALRAKIEKRLVIDNVISNG